MDIAGRGTGPPGRSSADRDLRRTAGLAGIDPRLGGTGGHAGAGPQPGARLPARSVRRGRWHGGRPGRRAGTADRGQLLEEVVARHGDPAEEETAQLRHWLDIQAKRNTVLTFGGGVNEIQRELIATAGLGLPRVPR